MKKYLLSIITLVAFSALVIWAADIDGTWTSTNDNGKGPQTTTLTLMSKGSDVTGKFDGGGKGGPVDISEGKIDGKNVSFKVAGGRGDKEYKGTVSASELKLQTTGKAGPVDMVFKKK
jgi:hypothetical protein